MRETHKFQGNGMTILIATALHDAVVLMADGRRSSKAVTIETDTAEKVHLLRPRLMLAVSGAVLATNPAVRFLQSEGAHGASELRQQLVSLTLNGTRDVLELITAETRGQASFRVGLIAAGFDANGAFLVNGLFGTGMDSPWSDERRVQEGDIQMMVVGGEECNPTDNYISELKRVFQGWRDEPLSSPVGLQRILDAGRATVRYATERCADIGGRIQYRVIRANGYTEAGFLA